MTSSVRQRELQTRLELLGECRAESIGATRLRGKADAIELFTIARGSTG